MIGRNTIQLFTKPKLSYLELHLTDHCNLNCKGCGHFSQLADKWFADISVFEKDMQRLAQLFSNISVMRLMGGEPLLHPEMTKFLVASRKHFPKANISVVTNGLLLHKMMNTFWQTCSNQNITIDITVYPIKPDIEKINKIARNNSVKLNINEINTFFSFYNLKGDSTPREAMRECHRLYYCPFLRDGKIYICAFPAVVHYFNSEFKTSIPQSDYLDIHSENVSGRKIIKFLDEPGDICRFCSYTYTEFEWDISKKKIEEWIS